MSPFRHLFALLLLVTSLTVSGAHAGEIWPLELPGLHAMVVAPPVPMRDGLPDLPQYRKSRRNYRLAQGVVMVGAAVGAIGGSLIMNSESYGDSTRTAGVAAAATGVLMMASAPYFMVHASFNAARVLRHAGIDVDYRLLTHWMVKGPALMSVMAVSYYFAPVMLPAMWVGAIVVSGQQHQRNERAYRGHGKLNLSAAPMLGKDRTGMALTGRF